MPDYIILPNPNGNSAHPYSGPSPSGYTPTQIRHAYGFDKISFAAGTVPADGRGTTIAIVDAFDNPTIQNDLNQFDVRFGLPNPPSFKKVNQTGGSHLPQPDANGEWGPEIALDVEWAHAIAPKANILLVEADDNSNDNLLAAEQYAAQQPGVVAISNSWGEGEFVNESSFDQAFQTPIGHTGETFIASSGDLGAPVGWPAIAPGVLSIGGTTLQNLDPQGDYPGTTSGGEIAWSGSGGGISIYEAQPTYQQGVVTQSSTFRTNPDVAYDSDPNTGFPVYDSSDFGALTPWEQFGGTSDASPQWAGLVALADQARMLYGEPMLDSASQTLPTLYGLSPQYFHDIVNGSSFGTPTEPAGPGYDLATGRGSPVADRIVAALSGETVQFSFSSVPTTATAGAPISITVTAQDPLGNTIPNYQGTIHFASSDALAGLPADYTFTAADNGKHTFTNGFFLGTVGTQNFTATDTTNPAFNGLSSSVTVSPAAATHFRVSAPVNVPQGLAFNVTVTALDQFNNTATGYAGTVHFTSSDGAAALAPNGTLNNGVGTFSTKLNTLGNQTVTATDTANSSVTGTSGPINVLPPPVAVPESVIVAQGLQTTITLYGSSPLNGAMTFVVTTPPAHGTLSGLVNVPGQFTYITYTSDANYSGPDSFQFTVTDTTTTLTSGPGTVNVSVSGPPTANAQAVSAIQPTSLTLTGTAPNGDQLVFALKSLPAHGTLTGFNPGTGQLTYTPTTNYIGPDTFQFTVTDTRTTLVSPVATISLTVPAPPVGQFGNTGVWQFNRATGSWVQLTAANASFLATDSVADVAAAFPHYGVWLYNASTGWKQIHPVDVSALAMDAAGDVVVNFPGYGVAEYTAGGWRTLTGANASLLAVDAAGDIVADFPHYGVWEFKASTGWLQLHVLDVTALAIDGAGDVAANFAGYGVGRYTTATGWQLINGVQASVLSMDATGDIVAEFVGYGVGEYVASSGSWRSLTMANAILLVSDSVGDFYGEFAGSGVWEFDPMRGWIQLRPNDASILAVF
jgi:hypothetical protein